ncbi:MULTISPECIES: hypothetical protein [Amycolatopsis]|uniref:Uncharacterized protein n=1 Tax=Amycolatopsis dendrobii TaxID=2760662 RepID=A0A7W3W232_9PSEU|nr:MULTISPECIES: hypothetical protein [Amycolatopsis]MBB1157264.1 hypothetical protein [Amycolatopsis dendrobii]UKD59349.1 hypothetical protein L3Q65_22355 [Amycolatopsis sp. FU40]
MDLTSSPAQTSRAVLGALHAIVALVAVVAALSLYVAAAFTESPLNVGYIVGVFCRMYGILVFPLAAATGAVAGLFVPRPYSSVVIWTTMPAAAVLFPGITLLTGWPSLE